MTTLEALRIARDRIARGWIQGRSYQVMPEGWCATGALLGSHAAAAVATCVGCVAEDLLGIVVVGSVAEWNDAPGRTQAEVLAAFDRAIALAEGAP